MNNYNLESLDFNVLYNADKKKEYLLSKGSMVNTIHAEFAVLKGLTKTEKRLDKDIYDMSTIELEAMLSEQLYKKENTVSGAISLIKTYLRWSYEAGYRNSNIEKLPTTISTDYLARFTYKDNVVYFTREELIKRLDNHLNVATKALMLCLFEGIAGANRYEEIRYMRKEDVVEIDGEYFVKIPSAKNPNRRKFKISEKLYEYLMETINTNLFFYGGRFSQMPLAESEYVFRLPLTNRNMNSVSLDNGEPIPYNYLTKRMQEFSDDLLEQGVIGEYDSIGLKTIIESGKMHYLNDMLDKSDDTNLVTNSMIDELSNRYDLPTLYHKETGRVYINYRSARTQFSASFMKEVYDKDIHFEEVRKRK